MGGSQKYVVASVAKAYKIYGKCLRILKQQFLYDFVSLTLILLLVGTIGDLLRGFRALHRSPWGLFDNFWYIYIYIYTYIKNSEIWIMQFWSLLEQMRYHTGVIYVFERRFPGHITSRCNFYSFHNLFDTEITMHFHWFWCFCKSNKCIDFRSESLCVLLNAYTYYSEWVSLFEKVIFWNETLLIFRSQACWRQELIWGLLEGSWVKYEILLWF